MKTLTLAVITAASLSAVAAAQDSPVRQLGAHVHGEASLSVALDASGLVYAELDGAAWNFYGFERAPASDAERDTIRAVRLAVSQEAMIVFPERAGCTLSEVSVDATLTTLGGDHAHDHDHGADHAHDDDHDHGHDHGETQAPDASGDSYEDDHGNVTVAWTYQCARAAAADQFDAAALFEALPRLERIEAEAFDGRRAAVRTLTPGDAAMRLD